MKQRETGGEQSGVEGKAMPVEDEYLIKLVKTLRQKDCVKESERGVEKGGEMSMLNQPSPSTAFCLCKKARR